MTVPLFISNSACDFAGAEGDSTTATFYDGNYVGSAVQFKGVVFNAGNGYFSFPPSTTADTWIHFDVVFAQIVQSSTQDGHMMTVWAGDAPMMRNDLLNDQEKWVFQTPVANIGTVFTALANNTVATYDIHLNLVGTTLTVNTYRNGTLQDTASQTYTGGGVPDAMSLGGQSMAFNNSTYFSQVMVTETSMVGKKMAVLQPGSAGNHTAWEGDFAELNDSDTGSMAVATESFQRVSSVLEAHTGLATGTIDKVVVKTSASKTGFISTDVTQFLRTASTDYDSSASHAVDNSVQPKHDEWVTNPNTAVAWTFANLATLEIGLFATPVMVSKRYWRFEFTTGTTSAFTSVQEIEFYSDPTTEIASTATVTTDSALQPGFFITDLVDGDLTTAAGGSAIYDDDATHKNVNLDFGSAVTCHHIGRFDRADSSSANSLSHTPRLVSVYHSDDDITYTLHFMGFEEATNPATWHYFNSPEVAGISADRPNLWTGIMTRESNVVNGRHDVQELRFFSEGVEKAGANVTPVSTNQSSEFSGALGVDNAFLADTSRAVTIDSKDHANTCWIAEMASPTIIDSMDMTSSVFPTQAPKDFSIIAGDGTTFVPVYSLVGETSWGNSERRTFGNTGPIARITVEDIYTITGKAPPAAEMVLHTDIYVIE